MVWKAPLSASTNASPPLSLSPTVGVPPPPSHSQPRLRRNAAAVAARSVCSLGVPGTGGRLGTTRWAGRWAPCLEGWRSGSRWVVTQPLRPRWEGGKKVYWRGSAALSAVPPLPPGRPVSQQPASSCLPPPSSLQRRSAPFHPPRSPLPLPSPPAHPTNHGNDSAGQDVGHSPPGSHPTGRSAGRHGGNRNRCRVCLAFTTFVIVDTGIGVEYLRYSKRVPVCERRVA